MDTGCSNSGFDMRSARATSSELRAEPDAVFRGGDPDPLGMFDPRHCAACDGTVTVVIVLEAF